MNEQFSSSNHKSTVVITTNVTVQFKYSFTVCSLLSILLTGDILLGDILVLLAILFTGNIIDWRYFAWRYFAGYISSLHHFVYQFPFKILSLLAHIQYSVQQLIIQRQVVRARGASALPQFLKTIVKILLWPLVPLQIFRNLQQCPFSFLYYWRPIVFI